MTNYLKSIFPVIRSEEKFNLRVAAGGSHLFGREAKKNLRTSRTWSFACMIWQSTRLSLVRRLLRPLNISSDSPSHQTALFSPCKLTDYCAYGVLASCTDPSSAHGLSDADRQSVV